MVHQIWWNNFWHTGYIVVQLGRVLIRIILKTAAKLDGHPSIQGIESYY